jgi:hypothetical protein
MTTFPNVVVGDRENPLRGIAIGIATLVLYLILTSQSFAGKSVSECQAFAHRSADQLREATAKNCGFPAGWNGTWQQNFDYCRSAESESTDRIVHQRNVMMNMCTNVCPGYAAAAVNDIRIATEGGCINGNQLVGVTGPVGRWSGDDQAHFRWCMSGVSLGTINEERTIRATEAPRCQICGTYADKTIGQAQEQQRRGCGYEGYHSGHQWSPDRNLHFTHCMGHPIDVVRQWAQVQSSDRHNMLVNCPTPQQQATCRFFAMRAVQQRNLLANVIHTCDYQGLGDSRWNGDWQVHYEGCIVNPHTTPGEDKARQEHLVACRAIPRASPSVLPLPPDRQCNVGVLTRLTYCLDANSERTTYDNPAGLEPACGLGTTEEEAEENALKAYRQARVGYNPTKPPIGPNQCEYVAQTIRACSCDPGLSTRTYQGQRPPQPTPADIYVPRPPVPTQSPADQGLRPLPRQPPVLVPSDINRPVQRVQDEDPR